MGVVNLDYVHPHLVLFLAVGKTGLGSDPEIQLPHGHGWGSALMVHAPGKLNGAAIDGGLKWRLKV